MTEEKRTLIETFLPVDEISKESKEEKKPAYHPPISDMKFYWTRKPLITARAAILGSIFPSDYPIDVFKNDIKLGNSARSHTYDFSEATREKSADFFKKQFHTNEVIICDPFAGGGSIPFEALRLGFNVYINDYNPLSWIILQGTLNYPSKVKNLEKQVEEIFKKFENDLSKKMLDLYPVHDGKIVTTYIYSWYVNCPHCQKQTPLVASWKLFVDRNGNNSIWLKPTVKNGTIQYSIETQGIEPEPTIKAKNGICIHCGGMIKNELIIKDIEKNLNYKMLCLVLEGREKKEFALPTETDLYAESKANLILKEKWNYLIDNDLIPIERITPNPSGIHNYFVYWNRLFNSRQLLLFSYFIEIIRNEIHHNIQNNEMLKAEICGIYLSFLLGKHLGINSRLSTYNAIGQNVASATSNKLNSIQWDHTEINPFSNSSGSLKVIKKYILSGIKYANKNLMDKNSNISIFNESTISFNPNKKFKLIVTDPPYKNDVPYGEFSDFFYVWESRALNKSFFNINPVIINTETPKIEEIDESLIRSEKFFERSFRLAINNLSDILDDDGILTLFFAHSSIEAWDFVIDALRSSGFRITATWPVHTEYSSNVLARGKASIKSSIIIVARKRKIEKTGYIEEINDEVKIHIMKRLDEFWNYGLRGADLTVSAMGATLDILTQYSTIKSYTGEMKIEHILKLVQGYVAQYVLNRYMNNVATLDAATSFYLYTRLSQLEGMPFDTANLIAKSMNVDLKLFEKQGLIVTRKKGKYQGIMVLNYSSREINPKQSLIDCVQFIMTIYAKSGFSEVERELATIPFSRNEIKDVLEALLSLPTEDPERQVAQKILERMGGSFPQRGQTGLDNF